MLVDRSAPVPRSVSGSLATDPVLTGALMHLHRRAGPVPRRLTSQVDAVVISHLHVDHLHPAHAYPGLEQLSVREQLGGHRLLEGLFRAGRRLAQQAQQVRGHVMAHDGAGPAREPPDP